MTIHTVFVRPSYDAEHVLSGMLPHLLRLEIGEPGPRLSVEMLYKPKLGATSSMNQARWSFAYDLSNGRLAGIDFHDGRAEPDSAYQEIAEALEWIRDRARALTQDTAWHHGLLFSSGMIARDWFSRAVELGAVLKPPFPLAPA